MIKDCNFSMGMILFIYCRQYFFGDAFKTFWPTGSKSFNVKLFPLARKFRFTSIQITFLLSIRVFPFQGTQWFRLNYIVKQSKTALDRWHSARHLIFFLSTILFWWTLCKVLTWIEGLHWIERVHINYRLVIERFLLWQSTKKYYAKIIYLWLRKWTESPECEIWNYFRKRKLSSLGLFCLQLIYFWLRAERKKTSHRRH